MEIYVLDPEIGAGLPVWLPNGVAIRDELEAFVRELPRARGLRQNDAHIYVAASDAVAELRRVLALHEECYRALGLVDWRYRLSLGSWPDAEKVLREALGSRSFFEAPGEAAFYGPKIDVQMKFADGREQSIASVQLDLMSASRFGLKYVASDGSHTAPWIIHRAPLGSHERMVSLLLEYYDGALPGWLAPVQLMVIPLVDDARIDAFVARCRLRVHVDRSAGSLSKRILFARRLRPFSCVVIGERELASGRVRMEFRDGYVEAPLGLAESEVLREIACDRAR